MIGRRGFLGAIAAAFVAPDPERLLWTPGKKLISIPKPRRASFQEIQLDASDPGFYRIIAGGNEAPKNGELVIVHYKGFAGGDWRETWRSGGNSFVVFRPDSNLRDPGRALYRLQIFDGTPLHDVKRDA